MIIGHGDIASVLIDHPGRCYFASGVSNSAEIRREAFERERWLLGQQSRHLRLVYFSSLCVLYSDTPYAEHKRRMEMEVKDLFPCWSIVRIGNITWGSNPHTLINALRAREQAGEPPIIHDVYRYVIDADELRHWLGLIPAWNCELNIPGRRLKVADIYREFVKEWGGVPAFA